MDRALDSRPKYVETRGKLLISCCIVKLKMWNFRDWLVQTKLRCTTHGGDHIAKECLSILWCRILQPTKFTGTSGLKTCTFALTVIVWFWYLLIYGFSQKPFGPIHLCLNATLTLPVTPNLKQTQLELTLCKELPDQGKRGRCRVLSSGQSVSCV